MIHLQHILKIQRQNIMISTIFGINGVGKDTLANKLVEAGNRKLHFVSNSRIMMYLLGITDFFDISRQANDDNYRALNSMDTSTVRKVELETYPKFIKNLASASQKYIMLSHLIVAQYLNNNRIEYLVNDKIPNWFIEINDWLIELVAPPETILARRKGDSSSRTRPLFIEQIIEHQKICNIEWERIKKSSVKPRKGMIIIQNINLSSAVQELERVLI